MTKERLKKERKVWMECEVCGKEPETHVEGNWNVTNSNKCEYCGGKLIFKFN